MSYLLMTGIATCLGKSRIVKVVGYELLDDDGCRYSLMMGVSTCVLDLLMLFELKTIYFILIQIVY